MPENRGPAADVAERARELGLCVDRLPDTIDRDTYTPALLGLLNNVLVWGGSRVFHHLHGVGTNEWRVISALGNHPGATAQELCETLGINKSIASKSVNLLLSRSLIDQLDGPRGSRHLFLTETGIAVHDDFMPVAMRRQAILHESLDDAEIAQLNALLVRMLDSSASMQAYEREILASDSASPRAEITTTPKGVPGT